MMHSVCELGPDPFVRNVYRQALEREPDEEEVAQCLNLLSAGGSKPDLICSVMTGDEAVALYDRMSGGNAASVLSKLRYMLHTPPETFIPLLFAEFLCRFAEDDEYDERMHALQNGTPQIDVIRSLLMSSEWHQLLEADRSTIHRKMLSIFLTSR